MAVDHRIIESFRKFQRSFGIGPSFSSFMTIGTNYCFVLLISSLASVMLPAS